MRALTARLCKQICAVALYLRCRHRKIEYDRPLPAGGAIYVANHLVTRGPLYVWFYMPVPVHIWINANLLDRELFVENVSKRYLEAVFKVPQRLSKLVAKLAYAIHEPVIGGIDTVPVYSDANGVRTTLGKSVALLEAGESLVVFPEKRHQAERVSEFHHGVAYLVKRYYQRTGKPPTVIPLALDERANMLFGNSVALEEPLISRPRDCVKSLEEALRKLHARLLLAK